MKANHTDILRKAQEYAAKATVLMQKYFFCCGIIVAIDEVFIEGRPMFIAVAPKSMLICNAGVYKECTEANWTEFLDEMKNLEQTVSDRGVGIMAAVTKRLKHSHQSDVFHCMYTITKALLKQEKQCYALIRAEEDAQIKLEKCTAAIERFDNLEQAIKMGFDALRLSAGPTFNDAQQARHTLDFVCDWIQHIQPGWRKVISAFRDPYLLTYMDKAHSQMDGISVKADPLDREYILATQTRLWEEQASRRWRGKEVIIPTVTMTDLEQCCLNLADERYLRAI